MSKASIPSAMAAQFALTQRNLPVVWLHLFTALHSVIFLSFFQFLTLIF